MSSGRLITIEGIDGTGKTTLGQALCRALAERGRPVRLLREPGGAQTSERIRTLVHDPALRVAPRTEALLYAAARAQLVEEVLAPALSDGNWVLLDRFVDSSLAYQGAGRRLGTEAIRQLNEFATAGLVPDRTLLLLLDPARARERAGQRAGPTDRLEQEDTPFFSAIDRAYRQLAAAEPARIRTIDAALPADEVLARALQELADLA